MSIGVISGSLQKKSYDTMLAHTIVDLGKKHKKDIYYIDISEVPLYNKDLETAYKPHGYPPSVVYLREKVHQSSILILCISDKIAPIINIMDWCLQLSGKTIYVIGGDSTQDILITAFEKMYAYLSITKFDDNEKIIDKELLNEIENKLFK